MANDKTPEQQQMLNQLAEYGKRLQELAYSSNGKYVVAGYAGNSTETDNLYCFCGIGNGYNGAPIVPANATAVLYRSKAKAEAQANILKYSNGYGERIVLKAMPASEYFWLLFDHTCKVMQMAEEMIQEAASRKQ